MMKLSVKCFGGTFRL